jgi:hypothetical protein
MVGKLTGMIEGEETGGTRASVGRRIMAILPVAVMGAALVFPGAVASAASAGAAPGAFTYGVSNLAATSVVLSGAVNPKGLPTTYVFQYGTTRAYGAQTPPVPVGGGTAPVKVSKAIGGLGDNTLYHYRIVATNAKGVVPGPDRAFTTHKIPLSLQILGAPNPVAFGGAFSVQGTLSGTGKAGRVVALQFNPFPYLAGFRILGNPEVTNAAGGFSFPVFGVLLNTQFRVVTTAAPFIASPVLVEGVAVRVSFHVHRVRRHRRGRFYRMYGTVAPAEVGARVGFQLLRPGLPSLNKGGTFVRSGTSTVSRFSTVVRVRRRGLYQALVQVADGSHVSAYSVPVRIR